MARQKTHETHEKRDDTYTQSGKVKLNRTSSALLEALRNSRRNVLNPNKRASRNNEKVALRKGE